MGVAASGKSTIGARLARALHVPFVDAAHGLVVSCSALKRRYLVLLRTAGAADVRFVYLKGNQTLLAERIAERRHQYMPPALLESQLATLEEPAPDENAWVYDIDATPEAIVGELVARST